VEIANEAEVGDVAADESGVYWSAIQPGDIKRADVDGKNPVIVFNGDKAPGLIALDGTNIYWTEANALRVRAVRKDAKSGTLAGELNGQGDVSGIAVSSADVFFHDRTTGEVRRTNLALGPPTLFTMHPPAAGKVLRLEANAAAVFMGLSGTSTNLVRSTPRSTPGAAPSDIAETKGQNLVDFAVDATRVYVADAANHTVIGVTFDGGAVVTYSATDVSPSSIAVDASYVYWTNTDDGTLKRAPLAGGVAPEVLATGQSGATNVAVNSRAVYWSTGDARVLVLQKP
jgi:hypothetical protein